MSLLLEALKKAERAKQEQAGMGPGGSHPDGAADLRHEGHGHPAREDESAAEQARAASALALEDLPAPAPAPARPAARGSEEKARDAAENLFAAKRPGSRKGVVATIAGVGALLFAAGGWYLWEQTQPKGSLSSGIAAAPRPLPKPPAAPAASGAVQPTAPVQAERPPVPPVPQAAAPVAASVPPEPAPAQTGSAASPKAPPAVAAARPEEPSVLRRAISAAVQAVQAVPAPPGGTVTAVPELKFQRSRVEPRVDPATQAGYDAFVAGDLDAAAREYRRALQTDPRSRDALLGLAAVATRAGRPEEAEALFRRALSLDPRDPVATAGLMTIRASSDPVDAESRLKTMATLQPDSAALQFALGNEYVRQSRWSDAQQAFFRAHDLDPASADIAFNLAVSLEHLDKPRLAAEYYRRAASLAQGRAAGFDPGQATRRAQELAP